MNFSLLTVFLRIPSECVESNINLFSGIFNICSDTECNIKSLVTKLANIWNIPENRLVFDSTHSDGILRKTVSNEKFKNLFPDYKFVPLDNGLVITCNWFHKNYEHSRR